MNINPSFLPQTPGTGFVMNSAGQLVPYVPPTAAPGAVPFTPPPGFTPRATFGLGPGADNSAQIADAVKTARASMASPAAALGETAGAVGGAGILSRIAGFYPPATAAVAGLAPFLADPGSDSQSTYAGGVELPNLPDEGDDLGITQIGKSYARGAKRIVKGTYDGVAGALDSVGDLFRTKDERALAQLEEQAIEAKKNPPPADASPTAALDYGSTPTGLPDFVIPGSEASASPAEQQLLALLGELRPKEENLTDEQKKKFKINSALKGLNSPADSLGEVVRNAIFGYNEADDRILAYEQGTKKQFSKEIADWAKNYAETAVATEKNRLSDSKDNVKIHQGKGGSFLVQATDDKGNTTLHPITGIGDKDAHITIGGQKYAANTPLTKELTLIKSLADVGKLGEILKENDKTFADNKIGASGDPKKDEQEKVLALAGALLQNPDMFKKYTDGYVKAFGQTPTSPAAALGYDDTPESKLKYLFDGN